MQLDGREIDTTPGGLKKEILLSPLRSVLFTPSDIGIDSLPLPSAVGGILQGKVIDVRGLNAFHVNLTVGSNATRSTCGLFRISYHIYSDPKTRFSGEHALYDNLLNIYPDLRMSRGFCPRGCQYGESDFLGPAYAPHSFVGVPYAAFRMTILTPFDNGPWPVSLSLLGTP